MTAKEIADLDKELKAQRKLKKMEVEKTHVRKPLDVNIISAQTLESLIKYLDLSPEDDEHEINKKLNLTQNNRRNTSLAKQPPSAKNATAKDVTLPVDQKA